MRRIHDFHGGIHPPERKTLSNGSPLRQATLPPQLVLPLSQHIGAPAKAVVSPGEQVLGGQRLTDLAGLPIHAPTSGTIAALEDRVIPHASGMSAPCIVIDCDTQDRWIEPDPWPDYRERDPAAVVERLHEAGIAGLGGAGFPTFRKLSSARPGQIRTLIINGTECEPYITADDILMRERARELVLGIEILAWLCQPEEILLGVEDNKPEAIQVLEPLLANTSLPLELVVFPTKYPSGGEKQLIEILTGQQVPSDALPADIGILCQNVGTAVAVHDSILLGRPLVSRITTVTGEAVANPGNYEVLLGTPMEHLLQEAGYRGTAPQRLIMGGPMMGVTLPSAECPVIKTTNCLLLPSAEELPATFHAQACIRCGLCAEACPATLLPQQLYWYARSQDQEQLEEHQLFDCIECGACSYVCPSHIPLVQYYRASKAAIIEQRAEAAKADRARERFEARQARLEQAAAEKEAKRAARKRAAAAKAVDAGGDDPIKAAIERAQARKAAQESNPASAADAAQEKIQRIEARLEKARAKLAADDGKDATITAALTRAVETTEKKLIAAREEPGAPAVATEVEHS